MKVYLVETTVTQSGDGMRSFQEAWRQATAWSIANGEQAKIAFSKPMTVNLTGTVKALAGANVVIDGRIAGDMTFETGSNDIRFSGAGSAGYNPQSRNGYGFTMFEVASGATLSMIDVALTGHLHVGATGAAGRSGDNGLKGTDGGPGLPGAPGNGGLSVATDGGNGRKAVGGIDNAGTVILDRVNFTDVGAFGGGGGSGGNGGNGGDGGSGGSAPPSGGAGGIGGPGGPGGSGTGTGGNGAIAAGGVLNRGTLTLIDTWFQNTYVSGGQGGQGGSGGSGGNGGAGSMGGTGGNGGFAGNGGNGASGAATVFNQGTMIVTGGWADGSNTVFSVSGRGGLGGIGGQGGSGGPGPDPEDDGFNGVDRFNGAAGVTAVSGEALFATRGFVATTFYIETVQERFAEYTGGPGNTAITAAIYRLGSTVGTASVALTLQDLSGGAGLGVQGGLFTDRVVSFAAGQAVAVVTLFASPDGLAADSRFRLTIDDPVGGALGGNRSASFRIDNAEVIGTAGADVLEDSGGAFRLLGGDGNDTLVATAGDDWLDGQTGIDVLDLSGIGGDVGDVGVLVDLINFRASSARIGNDRVFNIENVVGSRADDTILGGFGANALFGGRGNDSLDGGFGDDRLYGGQDADTLFGGIGNDTLEGGAQRDVLTGGAGADSFVFGREPLARLADHADRIADFTAGQDRIVLMRSGEGVFDTVTYGALSARAFAIGTEATTDRHRVIHDDQSGRLYYDPDGTGAAQAVLFARVSGGVDLTAADFLVL